MCCGSEFGGGGAETCYAISPTPQPLQEPWWLDAVDARRMAKVVVKAWGVKLPPACRSCTDTDSKPPGAATKLTAVPRDHGCAPQNAKLTNRIRGRERTDAGTDRCPFRGLIFSGRLRARSDVLISLLLARLQPETTRYTTGFPI